jgi:hypothetical protein
LGQYSDSVSFLFLPWELQIKGQMMKKMMIQRALLWHDQNRLRELGYSLRRILKMTSPAFP